ncbi:endonuclease G-like protein [Dinothrombium tinctorium]|uniref:Endonuclease n=1 Tax=Dinothrombium tinctorium TaxID=1965070 RepID=A0A443RC96_9ACAR|nr:endonuclease G-like protein [Dinothrombium tinctorium]
MNKARNALKYGLAVGIGFVSGVVIPEKSRKHSMPNVYAANIGLIGKQPSPDALLQTPESDSLSDANFGSNTAHIMKHGFPSIDHIRSYSSFVLAYDRKTRNALWVYEHLTPESLEFKNKIDRSNIEFFEDKSIHPYFRALNSDYKGSGYDRGHLAPAGNNRLSQELVQKTFVLSNISPQVGKGFNRGIWNRLEQYVRYRARKSINTWVCTGPLFLPYNESNGKKYVKYEVIGGSDVAVPTHFFKVLLVESAPNVFELECYVIQNKPIDDNIPLHAFQVPLDSIERAAGFLIFEKMPRNEIQKINGLNPYLQKFLSNQPKHPKSD